MYSLIPKDLIIWNTLTQGQTLNADESVNYLVCVHANVSIVH